MKSNPNGYRVNFVVDGERTTVVQVVPVPGAVRSGDYIEFLNLVPEYLPVSRKLLGIQAAIAEVLHMIGVQSTTFYGNGSGLHIIAKMALTQVY